MFLVVCIGPPQQQTMEACTPHTYLPASVLTATHACPCTLRHLNVTLDLRIDVEGLVQKQEMKIACLVFYRENKDMVEAWELCSGLLTSVSRAASCAGKSSTSMATPVLAALRKVNFTHNNEEDDQRVYVYKHPSHSRIPVTSWSYCGVERDLIG